MSKPIQIINPVVGGTAFATGNRARRFVRDGRAEWTDETRSAIRFISSHHSHHSAVLRALQIACDLIAFEYDKISRPLRREEMKHIPFAGNIDRIMGVGRKRKAGAKRTA